MSKAQQAYDSCNRSSTVFLPKKSFEMVAMDVLGPLPRSRTGNKYIIVGTDLFTKWMIARALPEQNAEAVAEFLLYEICLEYSMPFQVLSDQGTPSVSRVYSPSFAG